MVAQICDNECVSNKHEYLSLMDVTENKQLFWWSHITSKNPWFMAVAGWWCWTWEIYSTISGFGKQCGWPEFASKRVIFLRLPLLGHICRFLVLWWFFFFQILIICFLTILQEIFNTRYTWQKPSRIIFTFAQFRWSYTQKSSS
jgi:hypothetical protein